MSLTDWLVILATVLLAIAWLAARLRDPRSPGQRARHAAGMRRLVLGAVSVWASLFIIERDLLYAQGFLATHVAPPLLLLVAGGLLACGSYWTARASQLLKRRRLFVSCWR